MPTHGEFERYDSPFIPGHLSGQREDYIKKHNLKGAHWQHKDGGPGITGYATEEALKARQTKQGHKVIPHATPNEDHISKEEFNKRYGSTQHAEETTVEPGHVTEDRAREIVAGSPIWPRRK